MPVTLGPAPALSTLWSCHFGGHGRGEIHPEAGLGQERGQGKPLDSYSRPEAFTDFLLFGTLRLESHGGGGSLHRLGVLGGCPSLLPTPCIRVVASACSPASPPCSQPTPGLPALRPEEW